MKNYKKAFEQKVWPKGRKILFLQRPLWSYSKSFLEKEASDFATSIYLDDLIFLLSVHFVFDKFVLREKIKKIMLKHVWYTTKTRSFDPSGIQDELIYQELFSSTKRKYYLMFWSYSTTTEHFSFYLENDENKNHSNIVASFYAPIPL